MWLIETTKLQLRFFASPPKQDAILSHTWGNLDDEVVFQDMANVSQAKTKKGWQKIDSAELSEAINSMFSWYKSATSCYVYLSDLQHPGDGMPSLWVEKLRKCRWFTRCWTLQELLAPRSVTFFSCEWQALGTKETLKPYLSSITQTNAAVLADSDQIFMIPVGTRMSWEAERQATRVEDVAYCLLGIFNINMPLIYGEGPKAFQRLQEEIMKEQLDLSLFAWDREGWESNLLRPKYRGIFAMSPGLGHCRQHSERPREFAINTAGVRIETELEEGDEKVLLSLDCFDLQSEKLVFIPLLRCCNAYVRHGAVEFTDPRKVLISTNSTLSLTTSVKTTIFVKKVVTESESDLIKRSLETALIIVYRAGCNPRNNQAVQYDGHRSSSTVYPLADLRSAILVALLPFRGDDNLVWWDTLEFRKGPEKFGVKCVVFYGFQVDPQQQTCEPWYFLHCGTIDNDIVPTTLFIWRAMDLIAGGKLESQLINLAREKRSKVPATRLKHINDLIRETYGSPSGYLKQSDMPTSQYFKDSGGVLHNVWLERVRWESGNHHLHLCYEVGASEPGWLTNVWGMFGGG